MKTITLILFAILLSFTNCKKTSAQPTSSKTSAPNHTTNNLNDTTLIHIWVADSIKTDGQPTIITNGSISDTLKVTASAYQNYLWYGGINNGFTALWSTSGDSIFAGIHYKYLISSNNNRLWTYGKGTPSNIQYWYHKLH